MGDEREHSSIQGNSYVITWLGVDRIVTLTEIAVTLVSVHRVSIKVCIHNRRHSVLVDLTSEGQSLQFNMEQTVTGPM